MIARVLLAAVIAGVIAGATATAIQMWRVVPLILHAETYEHASPDVHHAHGGAPEQTAEWQADKTNNDEVAEPWVPGDGIERTFYTLLANLVMGVGFAMLLTAAVMFTGQDITPANGVLWGLLGFLVFSVAPNAGLPPELPGMPAADLLDRQSWWFATVAATAGGTALIALAPKIPLKAMGAVLVAAPHIIGAPHPDAHDSAVSSALAAEFAANTLAAMALFWIVLGVALGWSLGRTRGQART